MIRMTRTLRLLPLAALLGALLAGGAPSRAQNAPGPGGRDYQTLGLSADQKARVDALHKDIGRQMRSLGETLRARRQALEAVYRQYDLDAGKARALNNQINETQRAILDQHLRLQVELRKILTEDQFMRLQSVVQQRMRSRKR